MCDRYVFDVQLSWLGSRPLLLLASKRGGISQIFGLSLSIATTWFEYACFPKCILLAQIRAGKRISRSQSRADLVNSRLVSWSENKSALWQGVLSRCERGKSKKVPSPFSSRHDFEKRVLGALRVGDVRKALQTFVAAPIAPKTPETFQALKELHPPSTPGPPSLALPTHEAPIFQEQHVRAALFSFAPTSAAGLFGYRPSLLQQCARTESFHFVSTLTRAVNVLASGNAPMFLQPFLAGGVEPGCPAAGIHSGD